MAATTDRRGSAQPAGGGGAARGAMVPPQGDDTLTRFLREMALRLPLDRVVEAHVFPPIRQGGAETGVAVIAARRMETVAAEEAAAASALEGAESANEAAAGAAAAGGAPPHGEVANAHADDQHLAHAPDTESAPPVDEVAEPLPVATSDLRPPISDLPERHTVFSARYRLTLKGPDRGKWEIDVVEEADAPLVTVDAVVRGVQRRAGEALEPERFSADQLRAVVGGATAADAGA